MPEHDVKEKSSWARLCCWFDTHPRTGWYVTGLLVFNTILNLLELFK